MKNTIKYFQFFFVACLISLTSCQSESLDLETETNSIEQTETSSTEQNELIFTSLIYKGKTYTKQETDEDQTLLDLVNKSEFNFIEVIENENSEETNVYAYDSNEELQQKIENDKEIITTNRNNGTLYLYVYNDGGGLLYKYTTNRSNGTHIVNSWANWRAESVWVYNQTPFRKTVKTWFNGNVISINKAFGVGAWGTIPLRREGKKFSYITWRS